MWTMPVEVLMGFDELFDAFKDNSEGLGRSLAGTLVAQVGGVVGASLGQVVAGHEGAKLGRAVGKLAGAKLGEWLSELLEEQLR